MGPLHPSVLVCVICKSVTRFFKGGGGGVELRWCMVCVICNSNSFHSVILKLYIMIVHHNENVHLLVTFDEYFLIFEGCCT